MIYSNGLGCYGESDTDMKIQSIDSLWVSMSNDLHIQPYDKDAVLPFTNQSGQPVCYWLHCGCASLIRMDDGVRTLPVTNKTCFGIFSGAIFRERYALVVDVDSVISCQSVKTAIESVSSNNMWDALVDLHINKIDEYSHYYDALSKRSTYQEICFHINLMMDLPDHIRNQIKLTDFIWERTSMSRSNMMQVIGQLKNKKYIIVEKGLLRSVFSLPEKKFW